MGYCFCSFWHREFSWCPVSGRLNSIQKPFFPKLGNSKLNLQYSGKSFVNARRRRGKKKKKRKKEEEEKGEEEEEEEEEKRKKKEEHEEEE